MTTRAQWLAIAERCEAATDTRQGTAPLSTLRLQMRWLLNWSIASPPSPTVFWLKP